MIGLVDLDIGNIGSISNMLRRLGVEHVISKDLTVLEKASKLILPGVGAFDSVMGRVQEMQLVPFLEEQVCQKKKPFMGVCVGMQILANASEEGNLQGLGWIPGQVKKFTFEGEVTKLRVPHMGWNKVNPTSSDLIFKDQNPEDAFFYFVHSYYYEVADPMSSLATTTYGKEFTSIVKKDNIYGVQFHPEKSHKHGLLLFKNFSEIPC